MPQLQNCCFIIPDIIEEIHPAIWTCKIYGYSLTRLLHNPLIKNNLDIVQSLILSIEDEKDFSVIQRTIVPEKLTLHLYPKADLIKPLCLTHSQLAHKNTFIHLSCTQQNLYTNAKILTSLGFPVFLSDIHMINNQAIADEIIKILDLYLYNPGMKVPVEPFHQFIGNFIQELKSNRRRTVTLPTLYDESLGFHFFVSENKEVFLSKRFAQAGYSFGSYHDDYSEWMQSNVALELSAREYSIFYQKQKCALCEFYSLCKGYLKAIDTDYHCDYWQKIFSALKQAMFELSAGI